MSEYDQETSRSKVSTQHTTHTHARTHTEEDSLNTETSYLFLNDVIAKFERIQLAIPQNQDQTHTPRA